MGGGKIPQASVPSKDRFAGCIPVPGERLSWTEIVLQAGVELTRTSAVGIDDLRIEHQRLLEAHGAMLAGHPAVPIAPGDDRTDDFLVGPFWHTYRPRRSSFHHELDGTVWAVKGNGERAWRTGDVVLSDEAGRRRRAPITVNENPLVPSLAFFGGMPLTLCCREFLGGLLLRALCRRAAVEPATVRPLAVQRIRALPWEESGVVTVHGADEHRGTMRFTGMLPLAMPGVRSLDAGQVGQLGAYHYAGTAVHARVPEYRSVPAGDGGAPATERSTKGMFRDLPLSVGEREGMALSLAARVGGVLRVAHAEGISLSLDPDEVRRRTGHPLVSTQFSATHPSNISLQGEICDLETLRAEAFGDPVTERMRRQDSENAADSVRLWALALEPAEGGGIARRAAEALEGAYRGRPG